MDFRPLYIIIYEENLTDHSQKFTDNFNRPTRYNLKL